MIFRLTQLIALLLLLCPALSRAEQALTSIAEVRAMRPDEVDGEISVEMEGQVLALPLFYGIFLYDGTDGIYVSHRPVPEYENTLKAGDWIRLKGIVEPGGFTPAVITDHIEVIGHHARPQPKPYVPDDRQLAEMDCQWVSLSGRIIAVSIAKNRLDSTVTLESGNQIYSVQVHYSKAGFKHLTDMMFREVELNAVFGIRHNIRKQATGSTFIANSANDFKLVQPTHQSSDPVWVPIPHLMRKGSPSQGLIKTGGIVTGISENDLFLRGDAAGLRVHTAKPAQVLPGDYIEVTGYIWPQPVTPAFRALDVTRIRTQAPPRPKRINLGVSLDETDNYDLVQLQAQLIDIGKQFAGSGDEQLILLCRSGSHRFEARLPTGTKLNEEVSVGAELMLTGNSHLTLNPHTQGIVKIDGFWLQLRDRSDIQVLKTAPWWTPQRMIWAFSSLLLVLGIISGWLIMLRRTVTHQTRIIGDQVEREAVLNERQRIARELHDNLEQGIAGIAIQLEGCLRQQEIFTERQVEATKGDAVAALIQSDSKQTRSALKTVQEMLEHCSEESRSTIVELRSGLLERMDLPSALKETVEPLAKECGAEFVLSTEGTPEPLERHIERNLLLIAKEAATNAARHASPTKIDLRLAYQKQKVELAIEDDGIGFDTKQLARTSRFGILGIKERVGQLGGTIEIKSIKGSGTSIIVKVPLGNV